MDLGQSIFTGREAERAQQFVCLDRALLDELK